MPVKLPSFQMGVIMCEFAFHGEQSQLKRMLLKLDDVNTADYDKLTALHLAASEGHLSVVEFLLQNQAEVNLTV